MNSRTKQNIFIVLAMVTLLLIGVIIGTFSSRRSNLNVAMKVLSDNKLGYVLTLIDNMYVDSVSIDTLTERVLPLLISELDPHSVYIPAQDMGDANEVLDGEFDGIGVMFNMTTDTVIVLNVISAGPSFKAGVNNGDRIITIDDSVVAGRKMDQMKIVKMLRGKRGTKVNLGVQRAGIKDLVPITVERGVVPLKSIDAAFMIVPQIGFIKFTAFSRNSYKEMSSALTDLKERGMTKLILDLRGNTGGFLDQAILIANEFLPSGNMIVYTEDRLRNRVTQHSDGRGKFKDTELAILIDEGSASSSEILAGAIQDNDRGTIIGRRSYGKGLVQQQIPFNDGSAIRLTVARYYTPTGRSIQKPYTEGNKDYADDISRRFDHNEFFSADSIKFADSLKFVTPAGRIVYGGGGIMPDIFIPFDTTDMSRYYVEVSGRNIIYKYTIEYVDKHRKELNKIETVAELNAFFDRDPNLLNDFVAYATRAGVAPNQQGINQSRALLTAQLRALIGRNTPLEDAGFYSNIYVIDNVITGSIKELNKKNKEDK